MNFKIGDVIGPAPRSAVVGYVYNKLINGQFIMCRAERRNKATVLVVSATLDASNAKSDN